MRIRRGARIPEKNNLDAGLSSLVASRSAGRRDRTRKTELALFGVFVWRRTQLCRYVGRRHKPIVCPTQAAGLAGNTPASALQVSWFLELVEELALFGKITLRDLDRDGSCLDPTFSSSGMSSWRACRFVLQNAELGLLRKI